MALTSLPVCESSSSCSLARSPINSVDARSSVGILFMVSSMAGKARCASLYQSLPSLTPIPRGSEASAPARAHPKLLDDTRTRDPDSLSALRRLRDRDWPPREPARRVLGGPAATLKTDYEETLWHLLIPTRHVHRQGLPGLSLLCLIPRLGVVVVHLNQPGPLPSKR